MKEPIYDYEDGIFEIRANCYEGPNNDQVKPTLWGWMNGDMQGEESDASFIIDPKDGFFPIGTKISIRFPHCPNCDMSQENCDCGYDWNEWIENKFS